MTLGSSFDQGIVFDQSLFWDQGFLPQETGFSFPASDAAGFPEMTLPALSEPVTPEPLLPPPPAPIPPAPFPSEPQSSFPAIPPADVSVPAWQSGIIPFAARVASDIPAARQVEEGDTVYGYWHDSGAQKGTGLTQQAWYDSFASLNERPGLELYAGEQIVLPAKPVTPSLRPEPPSAALQTPDKAKDWLTQSAERDPVLEQVVLGVVTRDLTPAQSREAYDRLKQQAGMSESEAHRMLKDAGRVAKETKEFKPVPAFAAVSGLIGIGSSVSNLNRQNLLGSTGHLFNAARGAADIIKATGVRNTLLNNATPLTYSGYTLTRFLDTGNQIWQDIQNGTLTGEKARNYAFDSLSTAASGYSFIWKTGWDPVYRAAKASKDTKGIVGIWSNAFRNLSLVEAGISLAQAGFAGEDKQKSPQERNRHLIDSVAHTIDAGIYQTRNPLVILGTKLLNVAYSQLQPDTAALTHAFQVENLPTGTSGDVRLYDGRVVRASNPHEGLSDGLGTSSLWKGVAKAFIELDAPEDERAVLDRYNKGAMNYQSRAVALALLAEEKQQNRQISEERLREAVRGLGFVDPTAIPDTSVKAKESKKPSIFGSKIRLKASDNKNEPITITLPEFNPEGLALNSGGLSFQVGNTGVTPYQSNLDMSKADLVLQDKVREKLETLRHELSAISDADIRDLANNTPLIRSAGRKNLDRIGQWFQDLPQNATHLLKEAQPFLKISPFLP
jgi:hypothetical protein